MVEVVEEPASKVNEFGPEAMLKLATALAVWKKAGHESENQSRPYR
jgi:hypothetical protein